MTGTETTLNIPRLRVEGLTKSFFGVRVLDEISFDAYAGEVLGVVGENGSGKSTAMNILAGVLSRDGGSVLFDGATYSPRSRRESDAARRIQRPTRRQPRQMMETAGPADRPTALKPAATI